MANEYKEIKNYKQKIFCFHYFSHIQNSVVLQFALRKSSWQAKHNSFIFFNRVPVTVNQNYIYMYVYISYIKK